MAKKLGPNFVSQRPAAMGQKVAYIEGWKLIDLANAIFGFNGWSHSVVSTNIDFVDFRFVCGFEKKVVDYLLWTIFL